MTQLKRLLDEPGSDLDRVLLEAGLDEEPPKASLDRTLVALGVGSATAIGAGALGASGAGASLGGAKGLFGAGIAKWLGGALLASAAVGGGYLITHQSAAPTPAAPAPQAIVAPADPEMLAEVGRTPSRGHAPEAAPEAARAEAAPAADAATTSMKSQTPSSEAKLAAAPAEKPDAKTNDPKATQPKPAAEKASPVEKAVEKPKPDLTAGGGSLSDEIRTLDVARKASLAGDNDTCIATLANYSKKFPKGQMLSDAQAMKASCAAKKAASTP